MKNDEIPIHGMCRLCLGCRACGDCTCKNYVDYLK